MSLIIKGMELPKSCDSCDLIQFDDEGFEAHCPLSPYYRWCGTPPDYKPEGCRLVEIPTPHGRLIDADYLIKVLQDTLDNYSDNYNDGKTVEKLVADVCKQYITHCPTIIEADVSELSQ